ncbi:MAG: 5'-methylthioadenosine/S-adenosylhomocysteine nucleosidase [Clostridia bacterium]|nr:5'-methylthioadenosine/S-adenosylhomocysteine nucleosidase [Clostridia bacterium]
MKFGFIFADDMEYNPFLEIALEKGGEEIDDCPLSAMTVNYGEHQIFAVHSGVGKVNAAFAAQLLKNAFDVDYILSAGLSGAISGLKKNDIVAGETYVECDFDLRIFGYKLGQKTDGVYIIPGSEILLDAAKKVPGIKSGALGTGDFFLADKEKKDEYLNEFHINAFDMESAAIANVCSKLQVPFISVRKISDDADDSAADSYTELNNLAEKALSEILLSIVENM